MRERRQSDEGVCVSASETEGRYIWGCSGDEGPLDYDQTILSESPPSSLSASLNPLLYLDGTLENLIVTQHLTKTKVSGGQPEMTGLTEQQSIPRITSFTHVLACFPLGEAGGVGAKTPPRHTNKCVHLRAQMARRISRAGVCAFSFSFSASLDTLFIHIQHLP